MFRGSLLAATALLAACGGKHPGSYQASGAAAGEAARMAGEAPEDAASAGHRLAGWVIQRRGAVPDRDADAPYPGAG